MARIRSIKPEFWDDRKLASAVSRDARLFYIGLWNFADEHARLNGDPVWLAGHIFPYETDIGADDCARYLDLLERGSWVVRYVVDGDPYLFLPKLAQHQRLEPAKVPSRHPSPDEADAKPASDLHEQTSPSAAQIRADESAPNDDKSALLYVAGSREHGAGCMEQEPRDDPTSALLIEHRNAYVTPPPDMELGRVKAAIMALVAEGIDPALIRAGLTRMRVKKLGPGLLGAMVAESIPTSDLPPVAQSRNAAILNANMAAAKAHDEQRVRKALR